MKLWCIFVLEPFSLFLVCVSLFLKKKKKKRVIISHCLRECVVCSITCPPSLKSYYGFWVELWCAFVLEHFSHFLVWWVIVTHYLRECVVCSVTCPPFLKSYNNFWVKLWYAFVLDPLFLFPVCICFSKKKKKLNIQIKLIINNRTFTQWPMTSRSQSGDFFFFFGEFTRAVMKGKGHPQNLLGSKDLGTNVFRTLMCNVGKSW